MSVVIHHFVVHQLAINAEQALTLVPKSSCFDVTPDIETLGYQLNQAYAAKPGKGVGSFVDPAQVPDSNETGDSEQEDVTPAPSQHQVMAFRQLLQEFQENPDNFVDFSLKSSELLLKSLVETGTVETGFVIFSHYNFLATDYLLITLLNTKEHVEINQQLELNRADHLDLAKMQLAVRIDLTQWQTQAQEERYISFIKGRMGRKVSDFFMRFVGCEEKVDVKQQNKQLLNSVDDYLASEQLDPQEKVETRTLVADYYKEKLDAGEDIQLKELADKLPKDDSGDFYQFNQAQEAPLEEHFQADRAALKTLAKFSGQGGGISLSFDRKLYGERVVYNADTDTLMIKGIPPNLKDQLSKA
ncbi:nucleoid-associated protein YejK [Aestuariibacter halophilus]|uniref:Nucleoid-associated protein YejK n=1 Tax=Fluctibacter halophilus TaxID=226011 RepID=A0ABS8G5F6_9ALTE|nr:nucleoid-associated protein YejK [Aestuariibacter halophilus]MCC2615827.1 nucleoid-associated protein YejK [Aestuariibacter halophilus]